MEEEQEEEEEEKEEERMGDDGIHGSVAVLCATAESRRTLVYVTSGKGTGETRGCTRAGAHVGAHKSSTVE